jgi:hypothetical protein
MAYALSYREVIDRWQRDEHFVDRFVAQLAALPFRAIFWETPPIRIDSVDRPFTFVAVDAPRLAEVPPQPEAFAAPLRGGSGPVATFANLGGDAVLVVPRPAAVSYPHLLAFTRSAPAEDQRALWRAVGAAVDARLSERPVWVSTAGMGVYWLHVRLDDRPKYYRWGPYRDDPSA